MKTKKTATKTETIQPPAPSADAQPATTYEAMQRHQKSEAVTAAIKTIHEQECAILAERGNVKAAVVRIVNDMYRQGLALQEIVGRGQLSFGFFEPLAKELPAGFDFITAKRRLALTCKMTGEIKAWEELANDTQKEVLTQIEMLAIAQHAGVADNNALPNDPFTRLLNGFVKFKQEMLKATRACPLEKMSHARLADFLDDTQWVQDQRDKALELLNN
jgi:predicted Fe-S protein YdhL (DUF1289 family)